MNKDGTLKKLALLIVFAALIGMVLAGFASIMSARLSTGDFYLHYSSERTDPLGTRAFYEALDRLPEYQARRNAHPLATIQGLDSNSTLLLLGIQRFEAQQASRRKYEGALKAVKEEGTRLVLVINPQFVPGATFESDTWFDRREKFIREQSGTDEEASEERDSEDPGEEDIGRLEEMFMNERLLTSLGVQITQPGTYEKPEEGWTTSATDKLDESIALPLWQAPQYFFDLNESWDAIVTVNHDDQECPVVIERRWGKGTIVVTSDAYFVSNEALWRGGEIEFLLWLMGENQKMVFDESIHFAMEGGSIMKLLRKHRLEGFFIGAIIFVLLLAWRSGTSLVPGNESVERGLLSGDGTVSGEATTSGFIGLLRRSVPPRDLLEQCVKTWRSTGTGISGPMNLSREQSAEIEMAVARASDNPRRNLIPSYRKIVEIVKRR